MSALHTPRSAVQESVRQWLHGYGFDATIRRVRAYCGNGCCDAWDVGYDTTGMRAESCVAGEEGGPCSHSIA